MIPPGLVVLADKNRDGEEHWRAARHGVLTASDAGALLGIDPWKSRAALYFEKIAPEPPAFEENEAMRWGTLLEPVVAREFTARTGIPTLGSQQLLTNERRPWMAATPDFFGLEGDETVLVEIKTTTLRKEDDWPAEEPPPRVTAQVMWQLAVTGLRVAHVAALIGGQELRLYRLERDHAVVNAIIDAAHTFWHDHVLAQVEPPIDSHDSTTEALKRAFADSDGTALHAPQDIEDAWAELVAAKGMVALWTDRADALTNRLRLFLRTAEIGLIGGAKAFSWKPQVKRDIDVKALRAAHPDIAEQFTRESTGRVFRLHKLKDDDAA